MAHSSILSFLRTNRNIRALLVFLLFYVCFGAYLTLAQERFIYLPAPQDFYDCPALAHAEKVRYETTRMYVTHGTRGVVVLYHGNAGSACDRAWYEAMVSEAGFGMIIPEYAGYSNDTVTPSHARIQKNVEDVIAYLALHEFSPIYIIGESIGTGMASHHASLAPPEKIFLISPFTTILDITRTHYWYYPTGILVQNAFDNPVLLRAYEGHVTILHATNDTVIPLSLGKTLYHSIPHDRKTFVEVSGADHNDLWEHVISYEALQGFLSSPFIHGNE